MRSRLASWLGLPTPEQYESLGSDLAEKQEVVAKLLTRLELQAEDISRLRKQLVEEQAAHIKEIKQQANWTAVESGRGRVYPELEADRPPPVESPPPIAHTSIRQKVQDKKREFVRQVQDKGGPYQRDPHVLRDQIEQARKAEEAEREQAALANGGAE